MTDDNQVPRKINGNIVEGDDSLTDAYQYLPFQEDPFEKLTVKERAFVEHYIATNGDTPRSIVKAGYKAATRQAISVMGRQMLQSPHIKRAIQHRLKQVHMSPNEALAILAGIARLDIGDFFDIEANELGEMTTFRLNLAKAKKAHKLGLVKSVNITTTGVKLEFHDKLKAIDLIGKHAGLFEGGPRQEKWWEAAVRDIQNERVTYEDLLKAFGDRTLVDNLYRDAGVPRPEYNLPPGEEE